MKYSYINIKCPKCGNIFPAHPEFDFHTIINDRASLSFTCEICGDDHIYYLKFNENLKCLSVVHTNRIWK